MTTTRRAVLVGVAATLAGCGRSFRDNEVPGGLVLRNRHTGAHTLVVRAWRVDRTPTDDGEVTPPDDDPQVARKFTVAPDAEVPVPDFFPSGGEWAFAVTLDGERTVEGSIRLFDAAPGPAGVDTVVVTVSGTGALDVRVTAVD